MLQVVSQIERELKDDLKLLILNKFGKVEAEGAGMRDLIAKAAWMGIPAIVGVPVCNLHAWREFAGELSAELHDSRDVEGWLVRTVSGAPLKRQRSWACRLSPRVWDVVRRSTTPLPEVGLSQCEAPVPSDGSPASRCSRRLA
jgi:hypothetical protein